MGKFGKNNSELFEFQTFLIKVKLQTTLSNNWNSDIFEKLRPLPRFFKFPNWNWEFSSDFFYPSPFGNFSQIFPFFLVMAPLNKSGEGVPCRLTMDLNIIINFVVIFVCNKFLSCFLFFLFFNDVGLQQLEGIVKSLIFL